MSNDRSNNPNSGEENNQPGMEINLDRSRRIVGSLAFWGIFIVVGLLLAFLLMRFTGSKLIAFGLAGGMLLYMLISAAITSRNLRQSPDDGRLD